MDKKQLKILKKGVPSWNKWREENRSIAPNLRGANLIGVDLSGADLRRVDLSESDLSFSAMRGAVLHYANLRGADLTSANLSEADCRGVDAGFSILRGANLSEASLAWTNLLLAQLEDTDFSGSKLGLTLFAFTDLSNCKGLASVRVSQPCSIDAYTLRVSTQLPEIFLSKIGLPKGDSLNEFSLPSPVFLLHAQSDREFADKLYDALVGKGLLVWYDERKAQPVEDIYEGISKGINSYDKTIVICSENALNSWWVQEEIERLSGNTESEKEGLLIPITIDDHLFSTHNEPAAYLQRHPIENFKGWKDQGKFEIALERLLKTLSVRGHM